MSFNTALSGLRAANTDLAVTGNNIANASTVGFKASRTEFGDVYANALIKSGSTVGNGVLVTSVSQQFDQGNISFTDNSLDLAVNGTGFFVLNTTGGDVEYTRAGNFGLDAEGFIVSNAGAQLQGLIADEQGLITGGNPQSLQVETTDLNPSATTSLVMSFNLDAREISPTNDEVDSAGYAPAAGFSVFDFTKPSTFNHSTSQTIYDDEGLPHVMSQYFVKQTPSPEDASASPPVAADPNNTGAVNTWDVYVLIDGEQYNDEIVADPAATPPVVGVASSVTSTGQPGFQIGFTSAGVLDPNVGGGGSYMINNWIPRDTTGALSGASSPPIEFDFGNASQFGGEFAISSSQQNGFAQGRLAGVQISSDGVLFARYTNGEAQNLGQVVLANFDNQQGLSPQGSTSWAESSESGQPMVGVPQSGSLGAITAGALEESNVDLSEELVGLIIAQRNFQANSKTIETANTLTQTIINLR
ncbi:MAG: flagellar hook protein FlgE [Paraglaciecola psychrophila]|jgi:flagellar hook protein FlgE